MRTDRRMRQTDIHNEVNGRLSQFYERALKIGRGGGLEMFGVTDSKEAVPVTLHDAMKEFSSIINMKGALAVNWKDPLSPKWRHCGILGHYVNSNVNEVPRCNVLFWLVYIQMLMMRYLT